jgi:hypothetical protein
MITVVYCTRESNPSHTQHIKSTSGLNKHIEVIEIINKGEGLTKAYNRGLKQASNDIVVFMHDDIEFDTTGWGNKLIKHFNNNPEFGILGLAGTTDIPLSGRWWEDRNKMVGIVNHKHDGRKWESKYSRSWGNEINQVITVDGLFFAVHKNRIKNNFDENVKGFHFYEIDFVFSNHLKGVKIGVMYNIRVTHKSIGETNEEWENNRLEFVKKFNDDLPEMLVPDFYDMKISNEINNPVPIKVVIQSSGDVDTFKSLYETIMSFKYPNINIVLITKSGTYLDFKNVSFDNVKILEGYYDSLSRNLSLFKQEPNFIDGGDELVFLMNDSIKIINNIFVNFVKIYSSNKKNFGCGYPLSYNKNKTVFCSKLEIFANKEGKVAINMKDANTYYNVCYGQINSALGNLSDCIVTTIGNLKDLDWLNPNYETPLYFNEFSLKLHLKNKETYIDTNSLTVQSSFNGTSNIQQDFQSLITYISSSDKLKSLAKEIK